MNKRELLSKGDLKLYEKEVDEVLSILERYECKCSFSEVHNYSYIEKPRDPKIMNHIRIGLKQYRSNDLDILFDILHELGHHISKFDPNGIKIDNEIEAWRIAKDLMYSSQYLVLNFDLFLARKRYCLNSYNS